MRVSAENRKHGVMLVVGMAVTALIVLLIVAVFTSATKSTEIRDQQQENSPLIENTDRTLRRITNCTTPGRPCYERGQRQTATAVGDINRVIVLAAACASGPRQMTAKQIQACVVDRLASNERRNR